MSLYYPAQPTQVMIGSKDGTTRTSATLTAAYTGNTYNMPVAGFSKIDLAVLYTMGATETTNSIEFQIEHSPDGTNWYRIPNEEASSGVSTLFAQNFTFVGVDATVATISIGLDIFYRYLKVSVKESGVVTNAGTIFVEATLSGK